MSEEEIEGLQDYEKDYLHLLKSKRSRKNRWGGRTRNELIDFDGFPSV